MPHTIRDGPQAVVLAEHAFELTQGKTPAILNTLAAAYAETGNFEKAVQLAAKAKTLAEEAGDGPLASQIGSRLQLYVVGRPYHESLP